jgi:hypothetical protein
MPNVSLFNNSRNLRTYQIILGFFVILYALSLFKNISYPLLWNDEAETAVYAERILDFGFPKVHDGKNALNLFCQWMDIGMKAEYDAYIASVWGQYYFCVPGAWLARKIDDLYLKAALLRIPFALIGIISVFIASGLVLPLLKDNLDKIRYRIAFFLYELFSVYLVLFLREVRYYSLLIFFSVLIIHVYSKWKFQKNISFIRYAVLMVTLLFLLFNVFYPAFAVICCSLFGYEILDSLCEWKKQSHPGKNPFWSVFKQVSSCMLPVLVVSILLFPLIQFFEITSLSAALSGSCSFNMKMYFEHLGIILKYYWKNDFLVLILLIKALLLFLRMYYRMRGKNHPCWENQCKFSDFLTLFYLTMILFIARMPLLFERYFVWFHPFWVAMFILDLKLVYDMLLINSTNQLKTRIILGCLLMILCNWIGWKKAKMIQNHLYELSHPYKGPLDFVIPYIKEKYPHPERLVIATNYEEPSYMYYLKSRVTIGYCANNLEEDLKHVPDIIIYRKQRDIHHHEILNSLLAKAKYKQTLFPVFDYLVNNNPETGMHLYKTLLPSTVEDCLEILEKTPNASKS